MALPNLGFLGACLVATLTACSVASGQGAHDGGGTGGMAIIGSGGSPGDAPTIVIDGGAVRRGTLRMVVPAYYAPGPAWQTIIAAAPTVGMIIFNPANGPGTATDPNYTSAIAQARAAGILVLGYVATSYGQRPEADIMADVTKYYDLYAPSGIYFAEGPMAADCTNLESEYRDLTNLAKSRDSKAYLAIGTRFCPSFIEFSDLMVEFAEDWTTYQSYTVPTWMPANSPERFCQFINSVPPEEASHALSMAVNNGAGWVFATDGVQPNPWGGLPSYWQQELDALRALQ